ncbi:MAG: Aquaporin Z [Phycisphaerae bacterium]|nr:Aquaporin Z [Phycisphaerae bacterium]
MEGGLLGAFMISACVFGTLLEHPGSRVRRAVGSGFQRRALMGAAMGLTAVALIYSPWGEQSGAHMNPAVTLTFLSLGKVKAWDALFYLVAQFIGGAAGVAVSRLLLGGRLKHEHVNHVVTQPGRRGAGVAWVAELAIAFVMMLTVLVVGNDARLAPYTGGFAGALVALYIAFEAPLSGMSLNPARTFASAVIARRWRALWVYFTAPAAGMMLASVVYTSGMLGGCPVYCAKLDHCNGKRCIFRCEFEQLRVVPASQTAGLPSQE